MSLKTLSLIRHPEEGIIWAKENGENYLRTQYDIHVTSKVASVDKIHCVECEKRLQSIANNERWYCVCDGSRYFCAECFGLARPALVEQALLKLDAVRAMPRIMNKVMREIESHRHFASLPSLIRMEYEGAVHLSSLGKNVREHNTYIRLVWSHLYHGIVMNQ